ncbi:hypothetical protein M9Y10_006218 [Tritrichomonas musculus]|uniref:Uncharacterized protein n=1 Tax=Tritrichomonas musculus TaxID=1915356 RepID=A0ABR2JDN4_9EUKA
MEFEIKDGLIVKIDESNNTASITQSPKATGNIFIPRFYEKGNKKYNIISIEDRSFYECNIDSITFPEDSEVKFFGNYCLKEARVKKLQIPASVQGPNNFICLIDRLDEIEVSPKNRHFFLYNNQILLGKSKDNIDKFDDLLFIIYDVEEVVIPAQVSIIERRSIGYSNKLKSLKFETNSELKIIAYQAFSNSLIEDLLIPASVEVIGPESFSDTDKLKSVRFEAKSKLREIVSPFSNSSIESISIPENVEYIGDFEYTSNLFKIDVSTENKFFKLIDGNYIIMESEKGSGIFDTILVARRDIESIVIYSHIKHINNYAFDDCNLIKYVEFLGKYIKFNLSSFRYCDNISIIVFPNAENIDFESGECKWMLPKKARILVRKNAKFNEYMLKNYKDKIYYIEDIEGEEERLQKEEKERLLKEEEEEKLKKEDKIRQLESINEQLTNKIHQLESNEAKLQNQQKDFEEKLQNQQKDFEEKLQKQQNDFEEKLQKQQNDFENQKKEFEDQINQMKSMLELYMKQQAGFAKQNEESGSNKK